MNRTIDYVKINTTAQRKSVTLELVDATIHGLIFSAFLILLAGLFLYIL